MRKQFKELLHNYKVEAFKISHSNDLVAETTKEILRSTEETLNNAYHYRFRQDPDPRRIETFNMIKNYVLEALLPPVVEKLMFRTMVLEKQHSELVNLVGNILETLSDEKLRFDEPGGVSRADSAS